mmetsp:Transcript_41644/g.131238  ORF Transcript_41644/g.131238 Transcript_41644/m.131238 type:complete len:233 (-) Transcript_41644:866-1564(-)
MSSVLSCSAISFSLSSSWSCRTSRSMCSYACRGTLTLDEPVASSASREGEDVASSLQVASILIDSSWVSSKMSDKLFFPLLFAMNLAIRLHRLCLAVVKEDESVSSLLVKTSILPFCDLIVFPCDATVSASFLLMLLSLLRSSVQEITSCPPAVVVSAGSDRSSSSLLLISHSSLLIPARFGGKTVSFLRCLKLSSTVCNFTSSSLHREFLLILLNISDRISLRAEIAPSYR